MQTYVDPGMYFLPMWMMRTMEVSVAMTPDRAPESPRPLQPGNPEYSLCEARGSHLDWEPHLN